MNQCCELANKSDHCSDEKDEKNYIPPVCMLDNAEERETLPTFLQHKCPEGTESKYKTVICIVLLNGLKQSIVLFCCVKVRLDTNGLKKQDNLVMLQFQFRSANWCKSYFIYSVSKKF